MFTSPLKQLRQSTWLSSIPDQVAVPSTGSRPSRSIPIERATIDDIAFALIPLNRERSEPALFTAPPLEVPRRVTQAALRV